MGGADVDDCAKLRSTVRESWEERTLTTAQNHDQLSAAIYARCKYVQSTETYLQIYSCLDVRLWYVCVRLQVHTHVGLVNNVGLVNSLILNRLEVF